MLSQGNDGTSKNTNIAWCWIWMFPRPFAQAESLESELRLSLVMRWLQIGSSLFSMESP